MGSNCLINISCVVIFTTCVPFSSNCSSSSDTVEANSLKNSPIPKNTINSELCSVKSDCLYSFKSSSEILNTSGEIPFYIGAENKINNPMVVKTVLNDIKMEMQDLNEKQNRSDIYFQKEFKAITTPENFGNDNCHITETNNFPPDSSIPTNSFQT